MTEHHEPAGDPAADENSLVQPTVGESSVSSPDYSWLKADNERQEALILLDIHELKQTIEDLEDELTRNEAKLRNLITHPDEKVKLAKRKKFIKEIELPNLHSEILIKQTMIAELQYQYNQLLVAEMRQNEQAYTEAHGLKPKTPAEEEAQILAELDELLQEQNKITAEVNVLHERIWEIQIQAKLLRMRLELARQELRT